MEQGNKEQNPENGKSKGWLKTAFKAAAIYLVPLAFKKNKYLGYVPDTYRSAKRMVIAMAMQAGLQAGLTLTLPTAEDYLRDNNIDPSLATELSDNSIRVLPRDNHGKLYEMSRFPTIAGIYLGYELAQKNETSTAYATRDYILPFWKQDLIAPLSETDENPRELISGFIPEPYLEYFPVTKEDFKVMVTLHEIRHTASDNQPDPGDEPDKFYRYMIAEADADVVGIGKAAEILEKPELLKAWLYFRACTIGLDDPHNISLYLDASMQGRELPSAQDMDFANKKALSLIFDEYENIRGSTYMRLVKASRQVLGQNKDLDELTRRRIELFVEAAEYFAPSLKRSPIQQVAPALVPQV